MRCRHISVIAALLMSSLSIDLASSAERSLAAKLHSPIAGTATVAVGEGFGLPKNTSQFSRPGFAVSFTLPPDYLASSPVKVRLYAAHLSSSSCTTIVSASRPNLYRLNRPDAGARINAVGSDAIDHMDARTKLKILVVRPDPTEPQIRDLRAGDHIQILIRRAGDLATDTCTGLLAIRTADVRYSTTP